MSENTFQPDDELLSAYIDGELTAEELRAVEQWIATDPAASAMVEELRAVSGAVQSLPAATVPAEWTAKLHKRLDVVARGEGNTGSADTTRSLSIGRSMRGWMWSAAAIAAAVLIMFILPREAEQDLAMREREAPAPAAAPDVVADLDGADEELGLREFRPQSAAEGEEGPEARLDMLAAREAEVPAMEEAPDSNLDRADFASVRPLTEGVSPNWASNNTYFIVWADVPPDALREQQINTLLGNNGIQVSTAMDDWAEAAAPVRQQIELRNRGNSFANNVGDARFNARGTLRSAGPTREVQSNESRTREEQGGAGEQGEGETAEGLALGRGEEPEGETILVEATIEQILACVADMQKDVSNYDSIVVEPVNEETLQRQLAQQDDNAFGGREMARQYSGFQRDDSSPESASGVAGAMQEDRESAMLSESMEAGEDAQLESQLAQAQLPSQSQSQSQPAPATKLSKQMESYQSNARRLARPSEWYFYNAAPQDAEAGYQVREQSYRKKAANEEFAFGADERDPEKRDQDKRDQIDELNRYVQQQRSGGEANSTDGVVEAQPVQALFVLRNNSIPMPTSGRAAPAGAAASQPAAEAGDR